MTRFSTARSTSPKTGAETDLDLGHYERFTTAKMTRLNNFTTGRVYHGGDIRGAQGRVLGRDLDVGFDLVPRCGESPALVLPRYSPLRSLNHRVVDPAGGEIVEPVIFAVVKRS